MLEYVLEQNLKYVEEKYLYAIILVLQYFTFEAYLNFLGHNIKPKIWEKERSYFYKKTHNGRKSTLGKFWFLAINCECKDYFQKEGEEYFKFVEEDLKGIRDFFTHAKPEIHEKERLINSDKFPEFIENFVDKNVDLQTVNKGNRCIEKIILKLHEKAKEIHKHDRNVENPLYGPDRILSGKSTN